MSRTTIWRTLDEADLNLDLVSILTSDDRNWDGLLLRPRRAGPVHRRVAVLVIHGSVGNYLAGVPRRIALGLARAGYTVLSANTRMANFGIFFGGVPITIAISWCGLSTSARGSPRYCLPLTYIFHGVSSLQ